MRTGRPREGKELSCPQCGKLKYHKNCDIKRGRKFCSHLCSTIWWKGKPRKYSEESRTKRVLNLGTRMLNKKHSEETKKKMSLSSLGKPKLSIRGENNKWWQGGKTKLTAQIRGSLQYSIWRRNIFIRDNFCCTIGGREHGNKLVADHIDSFASILIKNNIKTLQNAFECFELWDITNGRTLCFECHKNTDNYGWKEFNNLYYKKS